MRRKRTKRKRREWTESHREALVTFDYFRTYRSANEHREGWEVFGEEITAEHIQQAPFTRPINWWKYDAPERRRCLTGPHLHDRPEFIAEAAENRAKCGDVVEYTELFEGLPRIRCVAGDNPDDHYESQRDYLIRLNLLLTDHERALLRDETH